jgi:hypothetical protein
MAIKLSGWKSILAVTSLCTALVGGVSAAGRAAPVLVAQQSARTPQTVTGRLDQTSDQLDDGTYYETHTFPVPQGKPSPLTW